MKSPPNNSLCKELLIKRCRSFKSLVLLMRDLLWFLLRREENGFRTSEQHVIYYTIYSENASSASSNRSLKVAEFNSAAQKRV